MNKIDNYSSFNYKNSSYSTTAYSLSEDFDGFIINEGTDLTFFNPSSFSHEFMTPQFASQSYFMGTTQENREFNFLILLKSVTMSTYKNFLRWLSPKSEGLLWFDYNPNYGYDAKVNSISEGKFTVNQDCVAEITYNIELTVGFITKNDWAAKWITTVPVYYLYGTGTNVVIDNGSNEPFIYASNTDRKYFKEIEPTEQQDSFEVLSIINNWTSITDNIITINASDYQLGYILHFYNTGLNLYKYFMVSSQPFYELKNNHSVNNFYKISWNFTSMSSLRITLNNIEYITDSLSGTIYTEYGIALNSTTFIPVANLVPYTLEPFNETTIIYSIINLELNVGDYIKIEPISREII